MKSQLIIHPEELSKKWIDKMADAGVDVLGLHPVGGEYAADSIRKLLRLLDTEEFRKLLDYAEERGLEVEYEFHSAGYLLERSLFETHPEYFRMNKDGERTPDYNFCVSNEEALNTFAENAAGLAKKLYKSGKRYYFWLDDGRDISCLCPKCQKLSASDQELIVINRMLSEIRKFRPDAEMSYLAYCSSVFPPEKVKPAPGVFLEYAPFAKYVWADNEEMKDKIQEEADMIGPLMNCFGGNQAKVLEYWYDNSLFSGWKKPPKKFVLNKEKMDSDVSEYKEEGFDYISSFACYLGEDYEELYGGVEIESFENAVKNP